MEKTFKKEETMKTTVFITTVLVILFGVGAYGNASMQEEMLGRMLYFDANLSNPAGQSCADCHHPKAGFADPDKSLPVSEGVIPGRYGTRNSPSSAYASFSPPFQFNGELWIGGQFWDGRASTLEEQAKGPFLNPVEMNNTKEGVIQAIRNSQYAQMFRRVYGPKSLNNVETAYDLVARAIAAFERTNQLNSFTSKYDFYLKGQVALTQQELQGLALFNDPAKGNCAACHPSEVVNGAPPLFTDFSYDNLGIPKNPQIEELIGGPVPVDYGLGAILGDPGENGKFKVMTLRNLAKTAPYGHNGYFKTLKEIVHFYNTRDVETWPPPEVLENVNTDELGNLGLTSQEEDDIVAFLMTLTDGHFCQRCR